MEREHALVYIGILLLIGGYLMPTTLTSSTEHCGETKVDNTGGTPEITCEETETRESSSPNQYRGPTILTGFVVTVVGVSIWGMGPD